jgi:uncharacterized protein involved in exopolysaccharide biosynthesis
MIRDEDPRTRQGEPNVLYVLQEAESSATPQGIMDLGNLARVAWRRKWWIAGFTLLLTALAVAYALLATEWYRAEAVLMPREDSPGSRLSAGLAQLGGLASIAGLNLNQSGKQEPLGVLRSKGFARRFIEQNDLVDTLARDSEDLLDPDDEKSQPDIRKIVDRFVRSLLVVGEDRKTGLVSIAVEWKDAQIAADWANKLTRQINDEMRLRALSEANSNIAYLRDQLAKTESVSLQQAIARLLENEMQKVMMAQGTDEYAFRIIDEAQPPARRARPKRTIITVLAFVTGLFISTFAAVILTPLRGPAAGANRAREQAN